MIIEIFDLEQFGRDANSCAPVIKQMYRTFATCLFQGATMLPLGEIKVRFEVLMAFIPDEVFNTVPLELCEQITPDSIADKMVSVFAAANVVTIDDNNIVYLITHDSDATA